MKRELSSLLSAVDVQRRVLSLLKVLGLVTLESTTYKTAKLTDKAGRIVNSDSVSEEEVVKLQVLFPPGLRGTKSIIQVHLTRFLNENPEYDFDHILRAAETWVRTKGDFCGDLKYFFYKKVEGGEEQRCLQIIESLDEETNYLGHVLV